MLVFACWAIIAAAVLVIVHLLKQMVEARMKNCRCNNCIAKGRQFERCRNYRAKLVRAYMIECVLPWKASHNVVCAHYSPLFKEGK